MIFGDDKKTLGKILNKTKYIFPLIYRIIEFLENSMYLKLNKIFYEMPY